MTNKKVEITFLSSNKSGTLSAVMLRANGLGLFYQKHQLDKIDESLSRIVITFDGDLNCSVDELTKSIESHDDIYNVENINIANSKNADISSNLESGSPFTILRAHYVITPESLKIAEDNNMSLAKMSLAFVNERPFLTSNIIGATNLEQLEENINSINISLSDDVMKAINEVHAAIPNPAP